MAIDYQNLNLYCDPREQVFLASWIKKGENRVSE